MSKIKKADLVKKIADRSGVPMAEVRKVMNMIKSVSLEEMSIGNSITIAGIVKIDTKLVRARTGKINGVEYSTPEHTAIKACVVEKYKKIGS